MKKISFLILALILVACSPQVTVIPTATLLPPTETPIPTPTLNPDFVAVQNFISDLNENLVLLPDGSVENNGVSIPNLHVDQNGVINIIFNNEHVLIEQSQISFDDESGLTINGYTLNENGEWVEAVSEAITLAQADFDKYDYDYSNLTFSENEEGKVVGVDQDGNAVYEDGKFVESYVVEQAAQLDLMPTNVEYDKTVFEGSGRYVVDDNDAEFKYIGPLFTRVRDEFKKIYGFDPYVKGKTGSTIIMLDPEINAWGSNMTLDFNDAEADRYLYYELADGTIHIVPLK